MAKIQPSVLQLKFTITEEPDSYIDLSQCASIASRRFYRQGLNWAVAGFILRATIPAGNSGEVTISKIPNTWVASNAWHKSYAHWKKQQDDTVREAGAGSAVAKYRDFKIHADTTHVTRTFGNNVIPVDAAGAVFSVGEWDPSQIVVPNITPDGTGSLVDPEEFFLHMVGANNFGGSRGMIDGYSASRAFPQSPDPVHGNVSGTGNWMQQMTDVGGDNPEILANAVSVNDDLPYEQIHYPGGDSNAPTLEIVHETTMVPSTGSTTRRLAGTNVPCGLIKVSKDFPLGAPLDLFVLLVPGDNRGYLTQSMQDM